MLLQLVVEESVPEKVVSGLIRTIEESRLPVKGIALSTFHLLMGERVVYYHFPEEIREIERRLRQNHPSPEKGSLFVPEFDALTLYEFRPRDGPYFNLGRLIVDHPPEEGLRLVVTRHNYFLLAFNNPPFIDLELGGYFGYMDGCWLPKYGVGIATLDIVGGTHGPFNGDKKVVLHEIGHQFLGFKHHQNCVMSTGADAFKEPVVLEFCKECEHELAEVIVG